MYKPLSFKTICQIAIGTCKHPLHVLKTDHFVLFGTLLVEIPCKVQHLINTSLIQSQISQNIGSFVALGLLLLDWIKGGIAAHCHLTARRSWVSICWLAAAFLFRVCTISWCVHVNWFHPTVHRHSGDIALKFAYRCECEHECLCLSVCVCRVITGDLSSVCLTLAQCMHV